MSAAGLADAIAKAHDVWCTRPRPPGIWRDFIAAAVAAHLLDEAVVEILGAHMAGDADSYMQPAPGREYWNNKARIAIRAALGVADG